MREKPPIAFYNFLPLVSGGIEDTGQEGGRRGGRRRKVVPGSLVYAGAD